MDKIKELESLIDLYLQIDSLKEWDIYYALRTKIIQRIKEL